MNISISIYIYIHILGMRISSEQEQRLFQLLSISGTSAFSYSDFIVFVCDPNNSDVIWKLRKSIAQSKISENEIIDALNYQDQNSSGMYMNIMDLFVCICVYISIHLCL
jgi:hypothetical protein